jgi:hypothetical protein
VSVGDYFEFVSVFWMPLLFGMAALLAVVVRVAVVGGVEWEDQ